MKEFIQETIGIDEGWHVSDPNYHIQIDAFDGTPGMQQFFQFSKFNPNKLTNSKNNWISMKGSEAGTSMELTLDIDVPEDAYYLIEMTIWKKPTVSGEVELHIGATEIHCESAHSSWDDYGQVIRAPITYIAEGEETFKVVLPKFAEAGWFKISKMNRFISKKGDTPASESRLDPINATFTQNSVNEINTMELTIAMKEDYYVNYENHQPLCFDYGDHITFAYGVNRNNTVPMFGGYIDGWSLNEEGTELTLTCIDRLHDLERYQVYKNISIAYKAEDEENRIPFTQFPTVNESVRYLCSGDYPINFDAISRDYIFYNKFATSTDVTDLTSLYVDLAWDASFGNPRPCMRIRPDTLTGGHVVLYQSTAEEWDAKEYNYFNFDYYAGGGGIKCPLEFIVDFYINDESTPYSVNFTGSNTTKSIGNVRPILNGEWQHFTIDLKKMLDSKYPSSEYIINEVRFTISTTEPDYNPRCSSMYIDQIMAYKEVSHAPRYASGGAKNAFEELEQICEQTNHIAYVRPGFERRNDYLILRPENFYTLAVEIIEGENVLNITDIEYKPREWGLSNKAHRTFNYNENSVGTKDIEDTPSFIRFGPITDHEFLSDINTDADAIKEADKFLDNNAWKYPSFTVQIIGSCFLEPGQYCQVKLPSKRIYGVHSIKSITHTADFVNKTFTTEISFGRPGSRFLSLMKKLVRYNKRFGNINAKTTYGQIGLTELGGETSSGAFR